MWPLKSRRSRVSLRRRGTLLPPAKNYLLSNGEKVLFLFSHLTAVAVYFQQWLKVIPGKQRLVWPCRLMRWGEAERDSIVKCARNGVFRAPARTFTPRWETVPRREKNAAERNLMLIVGEEVWPETEPGGFCLKSPNRGAFSYLKIKQQKKRENGVSCFKSVWALLN